MHAYRTHERHRHRRVRPRDYQDAFGKLDFADLSSLYERLPHLEWRVPGLGDKRVAVLRRCNVFDAFFSLPLWEARYGPWRVVLDGETVILGLDDDEIHKPDLHPRARRRIDKADLIYR
jgi:hypothetical protein